VDKCVKDGTWRPSVGSRTTAWHKSTRTHPNSCENCYVVVVRENKSVCLSEYSWYECTFQFDSASLFNNFSITQSTWCTSASFTDVPTYMSLLVPACRHG
jgi:hypothetical protein